MMLIFQLSQPPVTSDNWLDNFLGYHHQVGDDPDLPSSHMTALSVSSEEEEEKEDIHQPSYSDHQNYSSYLSYHGIMEGQQLQTIGNRSSPPLTHKKKNNRSAGTRDEKRKNDRSSKAKGSHRTVHSNNPTRQIIDEEDKDDALSNMDYLPYPGAIDDQFTLNFGGWVLTDRNHDESRKKGNCKHHHHGRDSNDQKTQDIVELTDAFSRVQINGALGLFLSGLRNSVFFWRNVMVDLGG